MYKQRLTKSGTNTWESSGAVWLTVNWSYSVDVEINDAITELTYKVVDATLTPTVGKTDGGGFWNFFGLSWNTPGTSNYSQNGTSEGDSFATCSANIESLYNQVGVTNWQNQMILWLAVSDKTGEIKKGTSQVGKTFTIPITPDMIDVNGNIKNISLVGIINRSYMWEGVANPYYYSTMWPGDVKISNLDWSYYPLAVKKGAKWVSCNRNGGSLTAKSGNKWNDKKNSIYPPPETVFKKKGTNWVKCPIDGEV